MKYSTKVVLQMTDVIGEYITVEKDEHHYNGPVDLCCGPSGEEEGLQGNSADFSRTLEGAFNTSFANQQDALQSLQTTINQIKSGQTGPGFSGEENAALISGIENQGAAAARNTVQAAQDRTSGQVFNGQTDSSGLARTSAIAKQIQEQAGSAAATNTANALNAETAANFDQGRKNAVTAASGLTALAGQYGGAADASMSGAINENNASFQQANKINQEKGAMMADIAGLATGAVKTGLSFASGGLSNLGDGGWDAGAFFQGGVDALGGNG